MLVTAEPLSTVWTQMENGRSKLSQWITNQMDQMNKPESHSSMEVEFSPTPMRRGTQLDQQECGLLTKTFQDLQWVDHWVISLLIQLEYLPSLRFVRQCLSLRIRSSWWHQMVCGNSLTINRWEILWQRFTWRIQLILIKHVRSYMINQIYSGDRRKVLLMISQLLWSTWMLQNERP